MIAISWIIRIARGIFFFSSGDIGFAFMGSGLGIGLGAKQGNECVERYGEQDWRAVLGLNLRLGRHLWGISRCQAQCI
jgi:hypothetical protein